MIIILEELPRWIRKSSELYKIWKENGQVDVFVPEEYIIPYPEVYNISDFKDLIKCCDFFRIKWHHSMYEFGYNNKKDIYEYLIKFIKDTRKNYQDYVEFLLEVCSKINNIDEVKFAADVYLEIRELEKYNVDLSEYFYGYIVNNTDEEEIIDLLTDFNYKFIINKIENFKFAWELNEDPDYHNPDKIYGSLIVYLNMQTIYTCDFNIERLINEKKFNFGLNTHKKFIDDIFNNKKSKYWINGEIVMEYSNEDNYLFIKQIHEDYEYGDNNSNLSISINRLKDEEFRSDWLEISNTIMDVIEERTNNDIKN